MLSVVILLLTSPAGIVGGWAYALDPRIPIWIITASFAAAFMFLMIYLSRGREKAHL